MEVLRRYRFRSVKAARAAELFEQVLEVVGPETAARARVLLEDQGTGASAIERAVKRFPELEPYQLADVPTADLTTRRRLSNVPSHHPSGPSCGFVSPETLLALIRGFPRSYPFRTAEIFFTTALPWQPSGTPERPLPPPEKWTFFGEPIERLAFWASWSPSGYGAFVHACVSLGDAESMGSALPPLPQAASSRLGAFGKPATVLLLRSCEDDERVWLETTARLRALQEEWRDRSKREMAGLALPHDLPPQGGEGSESPMTLAHKPALVSVLKPRGYRYSSSDSGAGGFALHKLTPNRNRIELSFDVGSKWRHYSGHMMVAGLRGYCLAPLPAHPEQPYRDYDIETNEVWQQVVDNVAVLVDHLERVFVPEVDGVLGRTPEWYEW
jgi:hypothetical protein